MAGSAPRALFVSYSSLFGGAERILLDCATGLESAAVACPDGPLAGKAGDAGLEVVRLSHQRLELRGRIRDRGAAATRILRQAAEVRAAARELRPDVVFGWNMRGLLVAAAALRGLKPRPPLVFQHNDLLPGPAIGRAVRGAAGRARLVVCLSRAIAEDLDPRGQLGRPIRVVHPGVDLDLFRPPAIGAADNQEVLVLGAIVGWKRPDLAVEIARIAAPRLSGLTVTLAGEPLDEPGRRLYADLSRRVAAPDLAGHVRLAGRIPDPAGSLQRAACLLHCAEREPFGLALVEALACGVPVVAADAAGPAEIVDESCGALYPPGDARAAAEALQRVISSPERRARLSHGARARAERLFDRERFRQHYRELVEGLSGR
jgi:glycosyltransferase involved in cell wall biosynthesis